ncbi:MAG: proton-conducting transporter membrane subunit, partial [Hydrogenophaga sp.]
GLVYAIGIDSALKLIALLAVAVGAVVLLADMRASTLSDGAARLGANFGLGALSIDVGVILLLARSGFESEEISDLSGLNQRSPLYAGVMAICMFSLAGIPPLVGFYAKLSVLQALLASGGAFHIGLAVFAVIMSLVGAFYYLRLVKVMYFDPPIQTAEIEAGADVRSVLSINGALVLVLGIVPGGLMALCAQAVAQLLA